MSPAPEGTSLPVIIDSEMPLGIECHAFSCGHGDTVLLCLPGNHWILVDCHLTKSNGTYQRFFEFLEKRKVNRLEYVVQTHPDIDHFLGMVDVLRYFTSDGRSVGCWCDSGSNSQQVRERLDPDSKRRYDELQRLLDELDEQNKITFHSVDKNGCEIGPKGFEGLVDLIPIAPDPAVTRRAFRRDVDRLKKNPAAALSANPLSVLFVVCLNENGNRFQLLLGADPEVDTLANALAVWEKRAFDSNRPQTFDAVKVPHHGSANSHCLQLCKMGGSGKGGKVALVSAGARHRLPERGVLADYLTNKWTLLITTTRHVSKSKNMFSFLLSKKALSNFATRTHDIQLGWSAVGGIRWNPEGAEITEADLMSYHSMEHPSPAPKPAGAFD